MAPIEITTASGALDFCAALSTFSCQLSVFRVQGSTVACCEPHCTPWHVMRGEINFSHFANIIFVPFRLISVRVWQRGSLAGLLKPKRRKKWPRIRLSSNFFHFPVTSWLQLRLRFGFGFRSALDIPTDCRKSGVIFVIKLYDAQN